MGVVTPMNPTRTPARSITSYGGSSSLPSLSETFADVYGNGRPGEAGRRRVDEATARVALEGLLAGALSAVEQAPKLVHALVELVVAERGHVEADPVGRLDRGLVVEVGRGERGSAHEIARVDLDRVAGNRGAIEVGGQPGRAAEPGLGRLDVAVQVVDAEQAQLHERALGGGGLSARA